MILILSKEVWYEKVRFVLLLRSRGRFSDYTQLFWSRVVFYDCGRSFLLILVKFSISPWLFQDLDFEFTLFHDHDFEVSRHFFNFFVAPPSTKAPFSSDRSYFTKDQVTPPTPYKKSTSRHSPPIILSLFTNYSITKPSKK